MKLDDYRKCFNLSYDQFIAQYNIRSNQVHENVRYEKITAVTRIDLADNEYFFFKDGKLKIVYISNDGLTKEIWTEFKTVANANAPEKIARSRAGKTSNQVIFAGHGITASTNKGEVDFIEIYPPCSLQDYLQNIYRESQAFIR